MDKKTTSFRVDAHSQAVLVAAKLVGISASQYINRAIAAHEGSLAQDVKIQREKADKLQLMLDELSK